MVLRLLSLFAVWFTPLAAQSPVAPTVYSYEIVAAYPHDTSAFTQGLFFHEGALFESTGHYGKSRLRKVVLKTGVSQAETPLPDAIFGEGAVGWKDQIIVLSWRSGRGLIFDDASLEQTRDFEYRGEGWGLTHDGSRLIMSDGTSLLRFLDPETMEETGTLSVSINGRPLDYLNELEWVEGEIFANVWQSEAIARIDPKTGAVTGLIDLRGLLPADERTPGHTDVLNGIAYNAQDKKLYVTGKYWPKMFEIEVVGK
ncbi:MAG: glutaminyl-peptide cyclotransferase [Pseudomonadota bacterium]